MTVLNYFNTISMGKQRHIGRNVVEKTDYCTFISVNQYYSWIVFIERQPRRIIQYTA